MQTIAQIYEQVTQAARDLRANGLEPCETNVRWWLSLPESQRREWLPERKEA
jgi:hypothetical protein